MLLVLISFDSPRPWTWKGCARYVALFVLLAALNGAILVLVREALISVATDWLREQWGENKSITLATISWALTVLMFALNLVVVARAAAFSYELRRSTKPAGEQVVNPEPSLPLLLKFVQMLPSLLSTKTPVDRFWDYMTLGVIDAQGVRMSVILEKRSRSIAERLPHDGAVRLAQHFDVTFLVRDRNRTDEAKARIRRELEGRAHEAGENEQVRIQIVLAVIQREDARGEFLRSRSFRNFWKPAKK